MEDLTNEFITQHTTTINLAIALLLGAIIGLERGWGSREQAAGERIAGIRTFALIGLLGGVAALLAEEITVWAFPILLISVVAITLVAFSQRLSHTRDFSITGLVGIVLTFCYGAIAVSVDPTLAIAAAVVTAIILDKKKEIHGLVGKLREHELDAALKLLAITVVLLPLLPDQNMGPGGALNPRDIWWMVVLIASVSFLGYFAVRIVGTGRGILFTSLFAGLTSSTALTLHYAKQSAHASSLSPQFASGVLIACGTMFPRILVYCFLINPNLLALLIWPVVVMASLLYIPALLIWKRNKKALDVSQPELSQNPLDLPSALMFGALLTGILLLGELLQGWLGDLGIYVLAATSGIADVDAITLSLTRMSLNGIPEQTAVIGIVIASSVNNMVKASIAYGVGHRQLGLRVAGPMALSLIAGIATALLI